MDPYVDIGYWVDGYTEVDSPIVAAIMDFLMRARRIGRR